MAFVFPSQGKAPTATVEKKTDSFVFPSQGQAGVVTKKANLQTSTGLIQAGTNAGISSQQLQKASSVGEDPKKIFSGGFLSDTFDLLNSLQYGVVGVLKGKGFIEGVKTRQSFSDKDALGNYGIPGMIAGIALDIAVDPLTYLGGFGILEKAGKALKGTKLVQEASKAAKETAIGKKLGEMFIYRFGQDPLYAEIAEKTLRKTALSNQNLLELAKPLTTLDPAAQRAIAAARKAGTLEQLSPDLLKKAKPAFEALDELGKKATQTIGYNGKPLLDAATYEENVGKYIARLYKTKEAPEGIATKTVNALLGRKPQRLDLSRFMKRTDIPEEVRKAMGEILEAGYPTAKSLVQLNASIEKANFFGEVAQKWGSSIAKEGLEQLPNTPRLGILAGKYVPEPIFRDLEEITRQVVPGVSNKIMAAFKYNKVILNPATHARNIMSNFILNDFAGLSPARIDIYAKAAQELATKGSLYKEAQKVGLGLNTFAATELRNLLEDPTNVGKFGTLKGDINKAGNKIADFYQKEEEFAKLAQFIFQRSKGLSPEAAWKIAESATFNYAQVTPFIRKVRESLFGYPFITFTYKATPQVAKTLLTHPTKISNLGKIKQAIENASDAEELKKERASEPPWVRDGFYIKLPMKDKYGRSAYFDLTYIIPFGDLVSGQLFERGTKRETGLPESFPEAAIKKLPLANVISDLGQNQDFYGNKIWKESDTAPKQLGDLFIYLMKLLGPPSIVDQLPGGYRADGTRREGTIKRISDVEGAGIESGGSQTRTPIQELIRNLGIKIQPVDLTTQEGYAELQKRRALETLLEESGVTKKFSTPFIPKK